MAQDITLMGASYEDVPAVELPKTGGGTAVFHDVSDTTATASDVVTGKTFLASDGSLTTGTASLGTPVTWFGAINPEFLKDLQWSKKLNEAENWPITPTDKAQNLTWKTTYTTTANANATYARYGKGYEGDQLDFGTYGYFFLFDVMVHHAYTSEESTLGKVHIMANVGTSARSWGPRPRASSGNIIYPSTSAYGTYAAVASSVNMCYYRNASNVIQLANSTTNGGVQITFVDVSMSSTSSVKPNYFNIRIPTFGVRYNANYMEQGAFSDLDAANTVLSCRTRIYRVPVANALYNKMNVRMLDDMVLGKHFPTETL